MRGQRREASDGAPHPGAQDCGHHLDRLEERSSFRRRTSKTTSSLSVCRESIPDSSRRMTGWFSRRSGSRVSIQNPVRLRRCFEHRVSRETLGPLGQPEKAIGHESPIEPWLALQPRCLSASGTKGVAPSTMNLQGRQNHRISSHDLGWTATRSPVAGEVFLLTSPFIERDYRQLTFRRPAQIRRRQHVES